MGIRVRDGGVAQNETEGKQRGACDREGFGSSREVMENAVYLQGEGGAVLSNRELQRGAEAEEERVDLGKGQRHLPTPSDCHPRSHRSHIKLKD